MNFVIKALYPETNTQINENAQENTLIWILLWKLFITNPEKNTMNENAQ